MPRTFSLVSAKDPGTLVARARRAAIENDADFRGNETSGSFSASGVKGVYRMDKKLVTVTITEKPFYVPWPLIEYELTRLLVWALVGAVLSFFPVPLTGIVLSATVIWMGFVLVTGRGVAPGEQPQRVR